MSEAEVRPTRHETLAKRYRCLGVVMTLLALTNFVGGIYVTVSLGPFAAIVCWAVSIMSAWHARAWFQTADIYRTGNNEASWGENEYT